MSQLIDQLKAQSGDPRSEQELTLVYGDQAAAAGRADIFQKNPDFASDYQQLKSSLQRMNRPSLGEEAMGGLKAGGDEMAAAGLGLGALATHAIGMNDTSAALLQRARADEAAGQQYLPSVPSITDISSDHPIEDTAYYLARGAGNLVPSLAMGAAGAVAGAALGSAAEPGGGTIAGGVAGAAEGLEGDAAVQTLLQKVGGVVGTTALKEAPLAAAFAGQSIGSNYVAHPESPGADIGFGAASGLLGAVAPGYVLSRFLPEAGDAITQDAAKEALSYWQRFAKSAATTIPIGGGATAASALVDIAADKYARGESPYKFTAADMKQALNAGVMGAVGGAVMAPFAAIPGGEDLASRNLSAGIEDSSPYPNEPGAAAPAAPAAAPAAPEPIDTTGLPDDVASAVKTAENVANSLSGLRNRAEQAIDATQQAGSPAAGAPTGIEPLAAPAAGATVAPAGAPVEEAPGEQTDQPETTESAPKGDQQPAPTEEPKPLDPAATITVASAQGDNPGFTTITQPGPDGKTPVALTPEQMTAQGYQVPDTTALAPGQYKVSDVVAGIEQVSNPPAPEPPAPTPDPIPAAEIPLEGAPAPVAAPDLGTAQVGSIADQPPGSPVLSVPVPGPENVMPVAPEPAPAVPAEEPALTGAQAPAGPVSPGAETPAAPEGESAVTLPDEQIKEIAPRKPGEGRLPDTPDDTTVRQTDDGPRVAAKPATDRVVSTMADRPQLRAQKAFLGDALKAAIKEAPETLAYSDRGRTLLDSISKTGGDPKQTDTVKARGELQKLASQYGFDLKATRGGKGEPTLEDKVRTQIQLEHGEHITIAVPGDGTFRIPYARANLENFAKAVDRRFGKDGPITPSPFSDTAPENRAKGASAIPKLAKKPSAEDLSKAVKLAASSDPTRKAMSSVMADPAGVSVATDGRRLYAVAGAGGETVEQIAAKSPGERGYPQWRQVVPNFVKIEGGKIRIDAKTAPKPIPVDTAEAIKTITQASSVTTERSQSIKLYDLGKGKIGFSAQAPDVGDYRSEGVTDASKPIAAVNPQYLYDAMTAARLAGHANVNMYIGDGVGPVIIHGGDNFVSVTMPVRMATVRAEPTVTSADFRSPPTAAASLLDSTVRALVQDRGISVVPLTQDLAASITKAAQASGIVITGETGKKIVGYAVDSVHGPIKPQTIISLMHEAGHVFTDGLPEDQRVAFQRAIDQLPFSQQRWLNNPESLDVRLLASADPATLSEVQQSALRSLTPLELAEARNVAPQELVKERMAEHLAQVGWDKQAATGVVDRLFRFIKDLWLQTSMSIQRALKGADSVSPKLAQQFIENRFLQFINRDAAYAPNKINDLLNWIGVPQTTRQRQPNFPGSSDVEMRMQYADPQTGALIPVAYGSYTPDSVRAYLQRSLDNASRYVRDQGTAARSTDQIEFTRRANFQAPMPLDPSATHNVKLASVNLEDEIYQQIRQDPDLALRLPTVNGQAIAHEDFLTDWLKLPEPQQPANMKTTVLQLAQQAIDPLTGKPVVFDPDIAVNRLPGYEETLIDAEKNPKKVFLSEQQDEALTQTILSLRDTQRRMQAAFDRDNDQLNRLIDQRAKAPAGTFSKDAQKELDELQRTAPLRGDLIQALIPRINELDSKFDPRREVAIYPTAEYLRVPTEDATEDQILAHGRGTVPRDLNFSNDSMKAALGQDLADMEQWLDNPDNIKKGAIYGTVQETYRKLMQIPTDLKRVNTKVVLRRTITNGLAEECRLSGLPSLIGLGKKIITVAKVNNENRTISHNLGTDWDVAFSRFAKAVGQKPDQTFRDTWWDPLNRIWDRVDISHRGELSDPTQWRTPIDAVTKQLNEVAGLKITTDAQRTALRDLMLSTTDNNRHFMSVELQNAIKVQDDQLGYQRRLVPRGIVGGRRTFARHLMGLFANMNPDWSDTTHVDPNDPRSFWEAAGDLYRDNRPAYDQQMAKMFTPYVVKDFVEPWAMDNDPVFPAPRSEDDTTSRMANPTRVRAAWRDAKGDVTRFAELLHTAEGGAAGDEAKTVRNVLSTLRGKFFEEKTAVDQQLGRQSIGHEILPRQLMDARVAHNWPAEHVSYATYTPTDNAIVLQHLAVGAAFGHDAIGANSEMHQTLAEARRDIAGLWQRHEELVQQGLSPKQIEAKMGGDDAKIARNYYALNDNIQNIERAFVGMATHSGYLLNDFKAMNAAVSFFSQMMINNPRSGMIWMMGDVLGPMASLKLSAPALRVFRDSSASVARDLATSIVRAFGIDANFNANLVHELYVNGQTEPEAAIKWRQKSALGAGLGMTKPPGSETLRAKAARLITRGAHYGQDIATNAGSPFQAQAEAGDEAAAVAPKFRFGVAGTVGQADYRANNRAGYNLFADLATRGLKYVNSLPDAIREQTVRQLELGTKDLDNRQLGYNRGWLLNDAAAFDSMKNSIETQMSGESSVGRFVAKAFRRQEAAQGGKFPILANSQFADIINLTNSYWTLQSNFATIPPWMNGALKPLFTFLTWPYQAMQRFGRGFTDARGRLTFNGINSSVADGMKTFFLLSAPATIAGSFAIDLYDKYALGKKQNMREASLATALPGVGVVVNPAAFMERIGRYGSAGFATDMLNRIINYDTQRNLSLDDRIVAVSEIEDLMNAVAVEPFQTGGNITYSSTVRPFLEAAGAGGMLQYMQVVNNLMGLTNQESAINARINTSNYLRAAGRELKLPVRVMTGPSEQPTPTSPYIHQMELAAIIDNPSLFREARLAAVKSAAASGRANAEQYVESAFASRHPLRRNFAQAPTEAEYRHMLGLMGDLGAGQTRQAVNNYNRYLSQYYQKPAFYGKPDATAPSIDQLIARASRAQSAYSPYSELAIHQ